MARDFDNDMLNLALRQDGWALNCKLEIERMSPSELHTLYTHLVTRLYPSEDVERSPKRVRLNEYEAFVTIDALLQSWIIPSWTQRDDSPRPLLCQAQSCIKWAVELSPHLLALRQLISVYTEWGLQQQRTVLPQTQTQISGAGALPSEEERMKDLRRMLNCLHARCHRSVLLLEQVQALCTTMEVARTPEAGRGGISLHVRSTQSVFRSLNQIWHCESSPDIMKRVLLYLLAQINRRRYRKKGDLVYEERRIRVSDKNPSQGTRSWMLATFQSFDNEEGQPGDSWHARTPTPAASSIQQLVHFLLRGTNRTDMFSLYLQLGPAGHKVIDYLKECDDDDFPYLMPQRHMLAFKNGIYNTMDGSLGKWMPWDAVNSCNEDIVAAKFFDFTINTKWFPQDMTDVSKTDVDAWWSIPTPCFQSILDYQNKGRKCEPDEVASIQAMREVQLELQSKMKQYQETWESSFQEQIDALDEETAEPAACLHRIQESLVVLQHEVATIKDQYKLQLEEWHRTTQCPALDQSMPHSDTLPHAAQAWIYVLLGRLLHPLGKHDKWQIILFLKGAAGTGKSTIANIVKEFFELADIGILTSNGEKKFGLQPLLGKLMFICFEVKKNIQLEAAEFQSMVSGEDVSVARKNKSAMTIPWTTPGLMCGNEPPGWVDAQGAIARRIVTANFPHKINEKDSQPDLMQRIIKHELAAIIIKCNLAYRSYAHHYGECDIWKNLPQYFKDERRSLQRLTDPLVATIYDESRFELWGERQDSCSDDFSLLFSTFEEIYRKTWRDMKGNTHAAPLDHDRLAGPFGDANLRRKRIFKAVDGDLPSEDWYIIGIRLRPTTTYRQQVQM